MAAYAALTSVMHILEQIHIHPRPPISLHKQQNESLSEIISFLQDFLENHSHGGSYKAEQGRLESRIADAAYAAEDIIESHIVDQILATEKSSNTLFYQDLQKVIADMNLIKKEVIEIQEKIRGTNDEQMPRNIISMSASIIGSSALPPPTRKRYTNTMVGFDDVLIQIMDRLTGYPSNRQVLPIVGMGGIGKTTLARNAYDNPLIVHHFHIRVWITISQEYRLRDILLEALSSGQNHENKREDELGHELYKSLCGKRYLVILDDVWSIEAWEKLMLFFPDNNNGSRIMITTRIANLCNHFGSCDFKMNFLDEDKSWKLFCQSAFPQDQCCPWELEETGKKIARNCKGLPLSIVVIGGLLANSEKAQHHWQYIAENLNPIVNLEDEMRCWNILYLSYNHLPIHLKPCFLYMGVFPEDKEIDVSFLIRLWVAERFLKPIAVKSLEVVAEEYLKGLIDRNLILVHKLGSSGKIKFCKIHGLLRDLCVREGQKDTFVWVRTVHDLHDLDGIQSQRRISIHEGASKEKYDVDRVPKAVASKAVPLASVARSLTCDFDGVISPYSFRLLRVFKMAYKGTLQTGKYIHSLKDIFKLVNLRYLNCDTTWISTIIIPSSIHLLWNLQTLIIKIDGIRSFRSILYHTYTGMRLPKTPSKKKKMSSDGINVPTEIWEMSQLRHLEIDTWFSLPFPDPPNVPLIQEGEDDFILRNLHTLKRVKNLKLSEEVIKRIPNIKKLGVYYFDNHEGWWHDYCLNNLHLLNKLESLYIDWLDGDQPQPSFRNEFLHNFAFPHSLKKLCLFCTFLLWEDMRMIGSLPHLQVLKLKSMSFCGPEWNPVEGEFLCLKFLLIENCNDLVCWNADRTHFPCLEHLVLRRLHNLKEIPSDIGQIPTIRSIELWNCSDSAVISAKNLLDEQVELGNEDLHVRVDGESQFSC